MLASRFAVISLALALSACASLGPCVLYDCPSVEIRHGDEFGCRASELAVAVNHDTRSHTFYVRTAFRTDGPYTLAPGGEMSLGCAFTNAVFELGQMSF